MKSHREVYSYPCKLQTLQTLPVVCLLLLFVNPLAAAPVLAPELKYCHVPLSLPIEEEVFSCCAPQWGRPAVEFNLTAYAANVTTIKVRRPAHALSDAEVERMSKAYAIMRNLPTGDPRSYDQQANIHCAYCSAVYQMGGTSTPLQVHGSWLFFAFHRWYIHFHERIMAKLLDDDTFALPFWNYDHPDGMTVPPGWVDSSELRNQNRDPMCLPPNTVMTDFYYRNASIRTTEEQVAANLATVYRQVISGPTTPYRFYGMPYRAGSGPQPGYGHVETMPHNSLHGWTGDQFQILQKDMGALYAAARDPVFYIHHGNIDRLWEVWRGLDRDDLDDEDYLNSEFVFYDENAELVKVKVRDCFDTVKLGYIYENIENVWLNLTVNKLSDGPANASDIYSHCEFAMPVLEPCSVSVSRNRSSDAGGEETLVIDGIRGNVSSPSHFDVFINYPDATISTMLNCSEYAGRYSAMAQPIQGYVYNESLLTSARFGLSNNVRELDLSDQERVVITIVPNINEPFEPISISNIWVEYEVVTSKTKATAWLGTSVDKASTRRAEA